MRDLVGFSLRSRPPGHRNRHQRHPSQPVLGPRVSLRHSSRRHCTVCGEVRFGSNVFARICPATAAKKALAVPRSKSPSRFLVRTDGVRDAIVHVKTSEMAKQQIVIELFHQHAPASCSTTIDRAMSAAFSRAGPTGGQWRCRVRRCATTARALHRP